MRYFLLALILLLLLPLRAFGGVGDGAVAAMARPQTRTVCVADMQGERMPTPDWRTGLDR